MNPISIFLLSFIGGFPADFCITFFSKLKIRRKQIETTLFNFKIHHSILGILSILIGLFTYIYFFMGFGIGIIACHTIRTKRFIFIERKK